MGSEDGGERMHFPFNSLKPNVGFVFGVFLRNSAFCNKNTTVIAICIFTVFFSQVLLKLMAMLLFLNVLHKHKSYKNLN